MKKQTALGLLLFTLVVSPLETTAAPIPATGETIVNATIDGIQKNAATAMDDAGNSVIVWESGGYVYAQRFDSSGAAVGEETLVSTIPGAEPQVAMDPAGNFVVVWQQYGLRLFAQQFDNIGNKLGAELIVDETELECVQFDPPTGCFRYSGEPAVAVDADGNFVVVYGGVLLREGIFVFFKRLDSFGFVLDGSRVVVNDTSVASSPVNLDVARDDSGIFVITWQDYATSDVSAQIVDAEGIPVGGNFVVNTYTASSQQDPAVAMDSAGNFVVAWTSFGQEDLTGIYAQRFNPIGEKLGGEFQVNTYTTHYQTFPDIAMDPEGRFVVSWNSYGQEDPPNLHTANYGVYAQAYKSNGFKDGGEFLVNESILGYQRYPSVGMSALGDLVIAWYSEADTKDVFARWYALPPDDGICSGLPEAAYCNTELVTLCSVTEGAASLAEQDLYGLLDKVFATVDKVNDEKYDDAYQKLSDFDRKLRELEKAAKPKISPEDADAIEPPLKDAKSCVRRL